MIEALEKSLGVVTTACKSVGINRWTHYNWYNNDEEYKKSVDSIADMALDFAESKLFKMIDKEDTTATIFFLKTKGKKRGYIEKTEIDNTLKGGLNNTNTIKLADMSDEDLRKLAEMQEKYKI